MRSIVVLLALLLAGGLLLPACHEDWSPLHDELGRTAEALGLVADHMGDSVGAWVEEACGEGCCEVPTRQEFSRAGREWARGVRADLDRFGQDAGRSMQDLGRDVGQAAETIGRELGDELSRSAEGLGAGFECLGDEIERLLRGLGSRAHAVSDAVSRFFQDVSQAHR